MSDKKTTKAPEKQESKPAPEGVITPERAKEMGLDPFPYGGK